MSDPDAEAGSSGNAESLIRAARARSNAALAAHDLDGAAREWMADVHVVSASGAYASRGARVRCVASRI